MEDLLRRPRDRRRYPIHAPNPKILSAMPTLKFASAVTLLFVSISFLAGCERDAGNGAQDQRSESTRAIDQTLSKLSSTKEQVPLVIRTDFSDDNDWMEIRGVVPDFANLQFVDDKSLAGLSLSNLAEMLAGARYAKLLFIADATTFSDSETTLLVVDLSRSPVRTFRCLPIGIFVIEANVSTGNMKFDEFANSAQADGVFRGFGG